MNVQCGHYEKRVLAGWWELPGFWEQGDTMKYKITLTCSVLSLCPISEREHVMMLGLHLWDFCC